MSRTALFRQILKEVDAQYTHFTHPPAVQFHQQIQDTFLQESPSSSSQVSLMDAQDFLVYLESTRKHKELMQRYYPTVNASALDKIKLTANRVGLELPRAFMASVGVNPEDVKKERLTREAS